METFVTEFNNHKATINDLIKTIKMEIRSMLKSNNIDNLNLYDLCQVIECIPTFFGCNKDGYGVSYTLDNIKKVGDNYILYFSDQDCYHSYTQSLNDIDNVTDLMNILDMLNKLFTACNEEKCNIEDIIVNNVHYFCIVHKM